MKYFFGFLASIALIIVVFFLVFRGLSGKNDNTSTGDKPALTSYANTQTVMQLTVDGPITANQTHNGYQITVGRDEVTMETYKGYEHSVIAMQSYDNNSDAYKQFLGALDRAGYTLGGTSKVKPEGACATGDTVQLDIIRGAFEVQHYWTTTCKEKGTFRGALPAVARLFKAQIPDYDKLSNGLEL
jgi:hypothetical protein